MAWMTTTYNCNHEGRVQIVGPGKDREWKARAAGNRLCPDCQAAHVASSADRSVAAGLAVLTGSDKQIAWGETCRKNLLSGADAYIVRVDKMAATADSSNPKIAAAVQMLAHVKAGLRYVKANKASAGFWIDAWNSTCNRTSGVEVFFKQVMDLVPVPAKKDDTKSVMTNAWAIARAAAAKFGGKAREYLSGALRQAWAEAKGTVAVSA